MTLSDYGSIAEIIGVFGMIASLAYVGYQLQQARVQMRGQASQARADAQREMWLTVTDRRFARTYAKSYADADALDTTESAQVAAYVTSYLSDLQNIHYQRKLGLLEDDQAYDLWTLAALQNPWPREFWHRIKAAGRFSEDFVVHVDAVIARQDAEAGR